MKNSLKPLFVFILISLFSVSCMQAKEPELESRNIALDFKLQDLSQNTFTLSSYKGKQPVILFFWATWCPHCRGELGRLKNLYPELIKEGWELFAIDIEEPSYIVENFVKRHGLLFKVLLDTDSAVAQSYGILGVPTYILIDKQGRTVFNGHYFPKAKYRELISQ